MPASSITFFHFAASLLINSVTLAGGAARNVQAERRIEGDRIARMRLDQGNSPTNPVLAPLMAVGQHLS